jgi:hypothetical protein
MDPDSTELADPDVQEAENVRYVLCSTLLHLPPPSDSTVSEDAGIEPRTDATLALAARRSNRSARSRLRSEGKNDPKFVVVEGFML